MNEEILFKITVEDVQIEASEKIGRYLTQDELEISVKKLHWGLLTGIDTVYNAIFEDLI